jgi:hypothetical protein
MVRPALLAAVVTIAALGTLPGSAEAAFTRLQAAPKLGKPQARLLRVSPAGTSGYWSLTAKVADADGDIIRGLVRIRAGAEGPILSRRIATAKRTPSAVSAVNQRPRKAAITFATLSGNRLRATLFLDRPGASTLPLSIWVVDADGNQSRPVAVAVRTRLSPLVTVEATRASATEAGDAAVFTVERTGPTTGELAVTYSTGGTATAGDDYDELAGEVVIPEDESSVEVSVEPIDDNDGEAEETVVLTIRASSAYASGPFGTATVRIADDDGGGGGDGNTDGGTGVTVTITAANPSAAEPASPGALTVRRSTVAATPLVVSYSVLGTAEPDFDYDELSGTVTIPAGSGSATITVDPIDDLETEGTETVIVTVVPGTGYAPGSLSRATVSIADNDGGSVSALVAVAATDSSAAEPSNAGTFIVTRSGSTAAALGVSYSISGTASAGTDYVSLPGSVTIPAGSTSATITVTPVDDLAVESPETVVVIVLDGAGYEAGTPGQATVTIADNDTASAVTVTASATDAAATEAGDTGTFTLTRTGSTTSALVVSYGLSGSAQNGSDYTITSLTVTIAAGSTSAAVTLTPLDDVEAEGAQTAVLTLIPSSGYTIGSPSSATVTIADDEPGVTIEATDASASEAGGDTGTFTVTRTGSTAAALTVSYTVDTATSTATSGSDFTALTGSVTIDAGSTTATITVTPIDDPDSEGTETVVVALTATSAYWVGSPDEATVTIADND